MSHPTRSKDHSKERLGKIRCGRIQVDGERVTDIGSLRKVDGILNSSIRTIGIKVLRAQSRFFDYEEMMARLSHAERIRSEKMAYTSERLKVVEYRPNDCVIEAVPNGQTADALISDRLTFLGALGLNAGSDPEHMSIPNLTVAKFNSRADAEAGILNIEKALGSQPLRATFGPVIVTDNFR